MSEKTVGNPEESSNKDSKSATELNEDEPVTMEQFCQQVDKDLRLKAQVMENRKFAKPLIVLAHFNECRYERGYTYQPIYSCQTCYL